ncbi:MAG: glycosyltransferase [Geminicoccaceae bacterium]
MRTHVLLRPRSNREHAQQIYAGFTELARRKEIVLEQAPCEPDHGLFVEAVVNGGQTILFDLEDFDTINDERYASTDVYFKRSYRTVQANRHPKLRPLGLNYEVHVRGMSLQAFRRARFYPNLQKHMMLRAMGTGHLLGVPHTPTAANLREPPAALEPRVIFMTRLWGPDELMKTRLRPDEIETLNEQRAGCVRALRREFGKRFTGGVAHTPFALQNYGDVLLPDPAIGTRKRFVQLLKGHPIAVQTLGLHGSDGFKLAEYAACSRAIVTEKRIMEVPGCFRPRTTYLDFATPDECVAQVRRLFLDADLRMAMMRASGSYFEAYASPAALVRNALTRAAAIPTDIGYAAAAA